jgi:hypothetical protein
MLARGIRYRLRTRGGEALCTTSDLECGLVVRFGGAV